MTERNSTTRKRPSRTAIMRAALEQCAASFVIKPADRDDIDCEGMAREFYRRMKLAKEALNV